MAILADLAIGGGALLAAAYCMLLSRRLRALTRLDGDVGSAIAVLSAQVDQLTKALGAAEEGARAREQGLRDQLAQADAAARKLELLLAADRPARADPAPPDSAPTAGAAPEDGFAPFGRAGATERRAQTVRHRQRAGAQT